MKKLFLLFASCFLIACSDGDSDSGTMIDDTLPGTSVPASFAGTYTGSGTVTASAIGITVTEMFPVTVVVTNDAMVRFEGDEPDETFTVGLSNDGSFAGTLPINEEECTGTASVQGMVDGVTASGTLSGSGTCNVNGSNVDVTLEGTFTATQ